MQADVKTKNRKKLKIKTLVDSGCTYTGIDKQLVKDKQIQTKPINFSFEVFNTDGTKNGEVTRIVPLEIEINGHKEQLEVAVTDLNRMDMFLGHDWLVKHNPEVNWKNGTIRFTRCPESCTIKHEDIRFKIRRTKAMETMEQDNGEISKEPDRTNTEDWPDYIQLFMYLFNKKKFKKLLERWEWDHEINLMEEAPRELNVRAQCKSLCYDNKRRWSIELMVGWTIESGINQGIEVVICGILFLHSKEGWIPMVGSRLSEVKSSYHQGQNATTIN